MENPAQTLQRAFNLTRRHSAGHRFLDVDEDGALGPADLLHWLNAARPLMLNVGEKMVSAQDLHVQLTDELCDPQEPAPPTETVSRCSRSCF